MTQTILSTAGKMSITNDRGAVVFPCPKCGYESVVRTSQERKNVTKYTCPSCGFIGPN